MIGTPIKADALKQITNLLQAQALFSGIVKNLQLRTSGDPSANSNDTRNQIINYDLTNKTWQIIKITHKGWTHEE